MHYTKRENSKESMNDLDIYLDKSDLFTLFKYCRVVIINRHRKPFKVVLKTLHQNNN